MWRPTGNAAHTVRIRIVVKTKMLENLTFYLDSFDLKLFQVDEGQGDDNIDHTFCAFFSFQILEQAVNLYPESDSFWLLVILILSWI